MPTGTMNYTGELTITTCWCGMVHAVPRELYEYQQRAHRDGHREVPDIYCPLGHAHIPSGESKAAQLKRELAERDAQLTAVRDQLAAAEREQTRVAKRVANGVCPCCNRSFVQLARHMKCKHPDYAT